MKTFTKSVVALFALSSTAIAADLPSRSQPKAPASVLGSWSTPYFIGVSGGSFTDSSLDWKKFNNLGVKGGYEFNPYFRGEVTYDYNHDAVRVSGKDHPSHTIGTNGVVQYKFGSIVPYAVAGVGYRYSELKNEPVFTVGAGARYEVSKSFEADLRYRYVADFDRARETNILTAGINYKF